MDKNRIINYIESIFFLLVTLFLGFIIILFFNTVYTMQMRGYNSLAHATLKNVYTATHIFFDKSLNDTITISRLEETLKQEGFIQAIRDLDQDVQLIIESGKKDTLKMISFHIKGNRTFTINSAGDIEGFSDDEQ